MKLRRRKLKEEKQEEKKDRKDFRFCSKCISFKLENANFYCDKKQWKKYNKSNFEPTEKMIHKDYFENVIDRAETCDFYNVKE